MPTDGFPRSLDSDAFLQLGARDVTNLCIACKITLPDENGNDEVHRLWTGYGSQTIDINPSSATSYAHPEHGETYTGAGALLSISDITENSDLGAQGIQIALVSSASNQFLTTLRQRDYQGKTVEVFLGVQAANSTAIIGLITLFEGFADQMIFSQKADEMVITLTCESKLIRLSKSSNRKYTTEDQKTEYPNDKGFDFVNSLIDKEVLWGRT